MRPVLVQTVPLLLIYLSSLTVASVALLFDTAHGGYVQALVCSPVRRTRRPKAMRYPVDGVDESPQKH